MFRNWLENQEEAELLNWMHGSVLVENGKPMILYHGTNKNPFQQFQVQSSQRHVLFTSFDVTANGFFFSESPQEALEYGRNIVACYVRMTNPLVDPRRDKHLGVDRLPYQREMHILKILGPMIQKSNLGNDGDGRPKTAFHIDLGVRRNYITPKRDDFPHQFIYNAIGPEGVDWDLLDNPQVVQRMKQLGYDGTFVQEQSQSGRSVFVCDANQIRVIDWNNKSRYAPEVEDDFEDDDFD